MNINLPTLLDVAIGLVFIFFIFSIFVSGIVELINTLLEQRAALLRKALTKILGALTEHFFSHQLTRVKREKFLFSEKPINYLAADSFSTVLVDLINKEIDKQNVDVSLLAALKPTEQTFEKIKQILLDPNPAFNEIQELIRPILAKSDDFQTFKAELEKWYNGYMEQVTGWFKRYAQWIVRIVATLVAVFLNVDTIYLTNQLFKDNDLRNRLVAEAITTSKNGGKSVREDTEFGRYLRGYDTTLVKDTTVIKPGSSQQDTVYIVSQNLTGADSLAVQAAYVQFVQSRIADLKLPIGWEGVLHQAANENTIRLQKGQSPGLALLGWLLTAAALSFGAPFWFDLLLKLVNIRNTPRRPAGNPDPV